MIGHCNRWVVCPFCGYRRWGNPEGGCRCGRLPDGAWDLCTPGNPCSAPDCATCHGENRAGRSPVREDAPPATPHGDSG